MAPMTGRIAHGTDGAGRDFRKDFSVHNSVLFKGAKIIGQYLLADSGHRSFNLGKSLWTFEQIADDEQFPFVPDELHRRGNGTFGQFFLRQHRALPPQVCVFLTVYHKSGGAANVFAAPAGRPPGTIFLSGNKNVTFRTNRRLSTIIRLRSERSNLSGRKTAMTANEFLSAVRAAQGSAPACGTQDPAPACGTQDPAPACGTQDK